MLYALAGARSASRLSACAAPRPARRSDISASARRALPRDFKRCIRAPHRCLSNQAGRVQGFRARVIGLAAGQYCVFYRHVGRRSIQSRTTRCDALAAARPLDRGVQFFLLDFDL
jgi:hypothetical protein